MADNIPELKPLVWRYDGCHWRTVSDLVCYQITDWDDGTFDAVHIGHSIDFSADGMGSLEEAQKVVWEDYRPRILSALQ